MPHHSTTAVEDEVESLPISSGGGSEATTVVLNKIFKCSFILA